MLRRLMSRATRPQGRAPDPRLPERDAPMLLLPLSLLSLVPVSSAGDHAAGDPPTELIAVFLLLLVFWGLYRVTAKKSG